MPDAGAENLQEELNTAARQLGDLTRQLPLILSRLLLAGVVIVAGVFLLRHARKLINGRLRKRAGQSERALKQSETFRSLTNSVLSYLAYFLIALIVLRIFGVDLTSLLTVAGIGSIALGFGAQTLVKDIISGMFLWGEGTIHVGDIVTVAGCSGRVETISLRTTVLRGTDGTRYAIPNGDIRTVVCRSHGRQVAQINVTVAHGQDLPAAQRALEDECARVAKRLSLDETPLVLPAVANDARCVTMRVECPCAPEEVWALERELRLALFERLRREDIKP